MLISKVINKAKITPIKYTEKNMLPKFLDILSIGISAQLFPIAKAENSTTKEMIVPLAILKLLGLDLVFNKTEISVIKFSLQKMIGYAILIKILPSKSTFVPQFKQALIIIINIKIGIT